MNRLIQMPPPLLWQLLVWSGGAVIGLLSGICALLLYGEPYLSLSLFAIAAVSGAAAAWLFYTISAGKYVVVEGVCQRIDRTRVRHRKKAVYIYAPPHTIRVELRRRGLDVETDDTLRFYVACQTPVYSVKNHDILSGYIAMEIQKGVRT